MQANNAFTAFCTKMFKTLQYNAQKFLCMQLAFYVDNAAKKIYNSLAFGLVAQLGERSVRIREVEGSIPFESTKKTTVKNHSRFFFFY